MGISSSSPSSLVAPRLPSDALARQLLGKAEQQMLTAPRAGPRRPLQLEDDSDVQCVPARRPRLLQRMAEDVAGKGHRGSQVIDLEAEPTIITIDEVATPKQFEALPRPVVTQLLRLFGAAGFDIKWCDPAELFEDGSIRVPLRMVKATWVDSQVWPIAGMHGSDLRGTVGILASGRLKEGRCCCIFWRGLANWRETRDLEALWQLARASNHNQCNIIFELEVRTHHGLLKRGGCWDEGRESARVGCCHFYNGQRSRWSSAEDATTITAMWVAPELAIPEDLAQQLAVQV